MTTDLEAYERINKMQTDTIKLWFTYGIALLVIVGGGIMLFLMRGDPQSSELQLAIVGFIGGALGFVFNRESATQATRAAESAVRSASVPVVDNTNPPA